MKLKDIEIKGKSLVVASTADVQEMETRLWFTFPKGYVAFVTTAGEGLLGGFIRIYPPWRITNELSEWRSRIEKYWFWDAGVKILPKPRALECVVVGDTVNGDEIVLHPNRPGHLFVLPIDSGEIYSAGIDLMSCIDWISTSNKIVKPYRDSSFEPFDSRLIPKSKSTVITDPSGESLDDIIALGSRWAKRHQVRKQARKEIKEFGPSTLVHEGFVIDGDDPMEKGCFVAIYKLVAKKKSSQNFVLYHKANGHSGVRTM